MKPPMSVNTNSTTMEQNNEECYHIHGYYSCPYFRKSLMIGEAMKENLINTQIDVVTVDRDAWPNHLARMKTVVTGTADHVTCPLVFEGCNPGSWKHVGGSDEFKDRFMTKFSS
eukprot:TRINITY_DN7114_c0_g1_i1.p1 TRINITY_DN7114_c0_g1~~TRINITY_DN7114_c0_g1_i1.p1  ORF type:complete len:114 (-),score=14.84 TRINITY_DN7114_c0_g1_i1:61-402(-)